ncbi:MAG TPA: hypothetical protein VN691_08745 [Steroidobacteraceae bacterium]|nr:hypothetical protein [Steroidobacteraceae bacterium]
MLQVQNRNHIGKTPQRLVAGAGLVFSLTLPELPSGTREFPAPAARQEQLSNGQCQQQRTQRGPRRLGRCAAHVDLYFECHGRKCQKVPGVKALNAEKGQMMQPM